MSISPSASSAFAEKPTTGGPGPRARGGLARGLLLVLLPLTLLPLIAFAYLVYRQVQTDSTTQAFAQLQSLADLKKEQITEYGFTDTNTKDYEEDHIISLENGGHPRDPKNLYPEAYDTQVNGQRVGAHEKDELENYVHNGICLDVPNAKFSSGPKPPHSLTLEQGQQILAIDWYKCYLRMKQRKDCLP